MRTGKKLAAYTAPLLTFIALLAINSALKKIESAVWLGSTEYSIYPIQTSLCGILLIWFGREYELRRPQQIAFASLTGIFVFVLWIAPQQFFGFSPRLSGFNPEPLSNQPVLYWVTVVFRFLRLVVVVPFVEEIFWRGFLLRYLIDERFEQVSVGAFSWTSFSIVTLGFAFSHSAADWLVALMTGIIYNAVAYRTKNLSSCILTHAITNLLLGVWIMKTGQWGFW
jgi:CAAX prenyl protease-like protein